MKLQISLMWTHCSFESAGTKVRIFGVFCIVRDNTRLFCLYKTQTDMKVRILYLQHVYRMFRRCWIYLCVCVYAQPTDTVCVRSPSAVLSVCSKQVMCMYNSNRYNTNCCVHVGELGCVSMAGRGCVCISGQGCVLLVISQYVL